ncbi:hypothetical protein [Alloactinosynnema sp. L-07]|uniref:hypothetical protein n=1 Tax=Alloactinosynnema sp. L-07 TaxID=1653480 RepID=UPI0012FC3651|nr:hypothetical protein [Alloactinosynnema sp. L-07]
MVATTAMVSFGMLSPTASAEPAAYAYPVRPGTAGWAALTTHQDMRRVTQLPADVVKRMPTNALVSTVLDYPLFLDALAYNDVQVGFEKVATGFNGLQELLRRPDSGSALLRRYQAFDAAIPAGSSELAAGNRTYDVWKLEMLLAQPQILRTLPGDKADTLLKAGLAKDRVKRSHANVYGKAGLEPTAVMMGRALAEREGWDWRSSTLLRTASPEGEVEADQVAELVRRHFAEPGVAHPISTLGTLDHGGTVYTPKGTAVAVTVTTYELSAAQINSLNQYVASNYPNATRETNASRRYNCHSYAWYSASTSNTYWMDTPNDDKYWNDGSYKLWHPPYVWFANMKASWKSDDHSGINDGTSSYIRSKWGQLPRMRHYYNYTPYDDTSISYYFR